MPKVINDFFEQAKTCHFSLEDVYLLSNVPFRRAIILIYEVSRSRP